MGTIRKISKQWKWLFNITITSPIYNFVLNSFSPTYSTHVLMNLKLFVSLIVLALIYMYTSKYAHSKTKTPPISCFIVCVRWCLSKIVRLYLLASLFFYWFICFPILLFNFFLTEIIHLITFLLTYSLYLLLTYRLTLLACLLYLLIYFIYFFCLLTCLIYFTYFLTLLTLLTCLLCYVIAYFTYLFTFLTYLVTFLTCLIYFPYFTYVLAAYFLTLLTLLTCLFVT